MKVEALMPAPNVFPMKQQEGELLSMPEPKVSEERTADSVTLGNAVAANIQGARLLMGQVQSTSNPWISCLLTIYTYKHQGSKIHF